jgi:hypothetical protein
VRFLPVLLAVPLLLAAASLPSYRMVDLGRRSGIGHVACEDFDGDGRAEILLLLGHRAELFLPGEDGGYRPEPSSGFSFPDGALLACAGSVDDDPATRELVFVCPEGVKYLPFEDGEFRGPPKPLLGVASLVTEGQEGEVHWREFLRDLDGDGMADIVLPTPMGYAIHYQGRREKEKGPGRWPAAADLLLPYRLRSMVEIGAPGLLGTVRGAIGVPEFMVADCTGDGRPDFVVDEGRRLRIFPGGEDGRFRQESPVEVDLTPLADESGTVPPLLVRDLGGAGRPDLILTRRREGATDLHLAGSDFGKPTLTIQLPGWSSRPFVVDLDGDGKKDLVVPTTPELGFTAALSVAWRKEIDVRLHVFLNRGDPEAPFRKEPDRVVSAGVRIRHTVDYMGHVQAAHAVLADMSGDYNGDGRRDLLYLEGSDELRFLLGSADPDDDVFEDSPSLSLDIPDTEGYAGLTSTVRDLNGDGKPDVVLLYESRNGEKDRVLLLLSAKE